jgi:hypothetical protein
MNGVAADRGVLGSAGYQPAGFGNLPEPTLGMRDRLQPFQLTGNFIGRLPPTAGCRPVLPNRIPV